YQIIVENTGNVALSFNPLSDSGCEAINPSGTITLAVGASATYTCTHVLNAADQKAGYHENCASATATPPAGQGGPITHPSNCVVVKVPTPEFTIRKLQQIDGSGKSFTTETLSSEIGKTVDYQIIVANTGNVALSFNRQSDSACEAINPSGTITLAVGASATYTCTHVLNAADQKAGYHEN